MSAAPAVPARLERGAVVVGIGMSSRATAAEVAALVAEVLAAHELDLSAVAAIATRRAFQTDVRLQLGPPVVGIEDDALVAASAPCERKVGLAARVAETAALLVSGSPPRGPAARSAHATAAIAVAATAGTVVAPAPDARPGAVHRPEPATDGTRR